MPRLVRLGTLRHTAGMDGDDAVDMTDEVAAQPYYTVHTCTQCGAEVHGLHGRWTCSACGECSPYVEPPEGWQADLGYRSAPEPGVKPRYRH